MPLCHGSLTAYNDGPLRPLQVPFKSRVPQRGKALEISSEVGPGTYTPRPGHGCPGASAAIIDPLRQGSAFASKSKKAELKKGVTSDVDFAPAHVLSHLPLAPGTHSATWPHGERKPPHFHVPFKPYPLEAGAPRGRSKGLDELYDLDATAASPVALFGTLGVNMVRSPRRYKAAFHSRVPSRPKSAATSGALGPGSYNLARGGVVLKDPKRPSSAFVRESRGKFANVGGSYNAYSEWLGIELQRPEPWT